MTISRNTCINIHTIIAQNKANYPKATFCISKISKYWKTIENDMAKLRSELETRYIFKLSETAQGINVD